MRPKTKSFTLAALDADGYLDGVTGAGPFTTIAAQPGDGLAHPLTILSTADLSGITFTCVGTDANGDSLTEAITGPNNTTVTSTNYFKTLVSVTASSTLGTDTIDVGWTALAESMTLPVDRFASEGPMVVADIGGTINYTLQQTNSNVFNGDTVHWATLGSAGATADQIVQATAGSTALRFIVASHTSGTMALTYSQASG